VIAKKQEIGSTWNCFCICRKCFFLHWTSIWIDKNVWFWEKNS